MGTAVSSSQVVSTDPSFSGGGLLTLCPCSSVGSLPWETVLHELLQYESCPRAAVLHKMLQQGSLPLGAALQNKLLQCGSPMGSTSPASKPAPVWAPHRFTASFRHPPALAWGPPSATGGYLLLGLQGDNLPHHCLLHRLHGNLYSEAWCTSSPTFFNNPGVYRAVSHIFLLLSPAAKHSYTDFSFLLNHVIPEVLPLSLMSSALASSSSVLESAGIGSVGHGRSI